MPLGVGQLEQLALGDMPGVADHRVDVPKAAWIPSDNGFFLPGREVTSTVHGTKRQRCGGRRVRTDDHQEQEQPTTKVFIGGSRRISKLDAEVKRRIDRMIEKRMPVIVGDANGADKAVQEYLRTKDYDLVEVFCSGDACRNNRGGWPTRAVHVPRNGKRKDFSFYATKDRAMAEEATVGLMLWDSESLGTVMNVLRLIQRHKKVVVYVAPTREFVDVKSTSDWDRFLSHCEAPLKDRVAKESVAELGDGAEHSDAQASLL